MKDKLILKEPVEEALPGDLGKIYKKATNVIGGSGFHSSYRDIVKNPWSARTKVDFYNSTYQAITPDEARQLRKQGRAEELRVIFDGQLVTFDSKGYQTRGNYSAERGRYFGPDGVDIKKYEKTKKPGTYVNKSNGLTFDEVVDRADKIYLVKEIDVDPDLRAERAQNPESRYTNRKVNIFSGDGYRGREFGAYTPDNLSDYQKSKLAALEYRLKKDGHLDFYDSDSLKQLRARAKRAKIQQQDRNARMRYLDSEVELTDPIDKLIQYRKDIIKAKNIFDAAKDAYNNAQINGSPDVQNCKSYLDTYQQQLKELMKNIARYEIKLQDAEDAQSGVLDELSKRVDDKKAAMDAVQAKINDLLRRN